MKTLCLMALVAVTAAMAARAGSHTNGASQLRVTDIYSDNGYYDGIAHKLIYHGNVRVIGPDMKLTCDLLTADLPESGGRLSHVVADTNVVFDATNVMVDANDPKGKTVHVTSQKAVYDYRVLNGVTNETITLTGNPQPEALIYQGTDIATNFADVIIWDRANNILRWQGNQQVHFSTGNSDPTPAETNVPAATNELNAQSSGSSEFKFPRGADTNFPPGKLDLIPPGHPGNSQPQQVPRQFRSQPIPPDR